MCGDPAASQGSCILACRACLTLFWCHRNDMQPVCLHCGSCNNNQKGRTDCEPCIEAWLTTATTRPEGNVLSPAVSVTTATSADAPLIVLRVANTHTLLVRVSISLAHKPTYRGYDSAESVSVLRHCQPSTRQISYSSDQPNDLHPVAAPCPEERPPPCCN